ncbi:hypothetical protein E1180_12130 [Roseibium denhamense]|nr:hypothetical protein [Roseibium denhamense]
MALPGKQPLLQEIGTWAETHEYTSAVLDLSETVLGAFSYVMPDCPVDDRHAAWYSDIHQCDGARLKEAVAIIGWKDGSWFAHLHAYWTNATSQCFGHLLPETLMLDAPFEGSGYGLKGARFEVAPDPETEFSLFRVKEDSTYPLPASPNALITTLAPFEDITEGVRHLCSAFVVPSAHVAGLGSLAGARFLDGPPMTGLISEILLRPGQCRVTDDTDRLVVRGIDLTGTHVQGTLAAGDAPTLITNELLLVSDTKIP